MILLLALLVAQAGAAGPIKVAPHGLADSQQGTFLQSGSGATLRTIESKLRDTVAVADFAGTDICDQITTAMGALPAAGGTIDARMISANLTCASSLNINKHAVVILFPPQTINMQSNQILVPVGSDNVQLIGTGSYGSPAAATAGTVITYLGTGTAVVVGDVSLNGNIWGFMLQDVAIHINNSGQTAAIGLQLNRAINYNLIRPRVAGYIPANTQVLIDLQGGAGFTGGYIENPYLSNGNVGIQFGTAANANTVVGGEIGCAGGIGYLFGSGAGVAYENAILGGDIENCATALKLDRASGNRIYGLRMEANTAAINATVNSLRNVVDIERTTATITDNGVDNRFTTDLNPQLSQSLLKIKNAVDAAVTVDLTAGTSAAQNILLNFRKYDATLQWQIVKDTAEALSILNGTNGNVRLSFGSANTQIGGEGAGNLQFNVSANSGTGGFAFGSGGASPSVVATIDSAGNAHFAGTKSVGSCTLNAASPAVCTATVASGAKCVAVPTGTTAVAATHTLATSVTTTTLTVTGANGLTDVVTYLCF